MRRHRPLFVCAIVFLSTAGLSAQDPFEFSTPIQGPARSVIVGPDGKPMVISSSPVPAGAPPIRPAKPMPAKPGDDKSKKKKAEGDDKKKEKQGDDSKVITRPDKPPLPANPDELKVKPNGQGMVRFNFRYQSWPDVMDWLAEISHMSLDWQELPKDYLNLTTQREYSVLATRDLINRHLLARGFTLLDNGVELRVVAVAKLNPAMVPRIRSEDLAELAQEQPYRFVKVSYSLDWLLAAESAEEFKPMLSPNGKLIPLRNTNRLEGVDAAINLHEINTVINQEQSDTGDSPLVNEFVLVHARATDVLENLQSLLGLQSKSAPAVSMSSSQMRAMQQQQQAMMQQMAQQRAQKGATSAAKKAPSVNLVVNKRKNSILAHAPPDKMAIIAQAIEALDVRTDRLDSLLAKPSQMEIYRLNNLDPAALAKTLNDLGDLEPSTHLDVDAKNNSLIVYGSLVDQATIRQLVQRLDGNSRHFEVMRLRRLAADYVAGTVEFMMVGEKEEDNQPRFYDYYSGRYGGQQNKKSDDAFRVDADVQNNMLLLWANDQEIESVMQLLEKLGELPPQGGNPEKVRVLTTIAPEDAAEFLDKLRRAWPSLLPNELNLPDLPEASMPRPETDQGESDNKEVRARPHPGSDHVLPVVLIDADEALVTSSDGQPAKVSVNDSLPTDGSQPRKAAPEATDTSPPAVQSEPTNQELLRRFLADKAKQQNASPPPVNLSIAPDGSLVITSDDTEALDVLEELILQTAPSVPDYKVFKIKYADAYWVMDNIEEFFKEDEDEEGGFNPFFFDFSRPQQGQSRSRLSQRRKLKFIYDLDTNSILVQGADARQLKTIEDLIAVYDQQEPASSQSARVSTVFSIRYSKASIIADAIKDVYRDLLSSNDKALQSNNPEKKNRESREATFIFGGSDSGEPDRTQVKFKGKLSLGVDEITNTLLVSAEGENLMLNVAEMVKTLDEAAKPLSNFSIVHLKGNTNASRVREVLATLLSDGQKPQQQQTPSNGQNPPQNGNTGRPGAAPQNSPTGAAIRIAPQ